MSSNKNKVKNLIRLTSITLLIDFGFLLGLVLSLWLLIIEESSTFIIWTLYSKNAMPPSSFYQLISLIYKHVLLLLILEFLKVILDLDIFEILLLAGFQLSIILVQHLLQFLNISVDSLNLSPLNVINRGQSRVLFFECG